MKSRHILFLCLVVLLLAGCSHTIRVPIERAPMVRLGVERIAVGRIEGIGGEDLENKISARLCNMDYYEFIERAKVENALTEQNLTWTEAAIAENAAKLAETIGDVAIIFGTVTDSRYDEDPVKYRTTYDEDSTMHRIGKRHGTAVFEVKIKAIDTSSDNSVFLEHFSAKKQKTVEAQDSPPEPIDGFELLTKCRADVARKFVRKISPYTSVLVLKFRLKKKIQELEKGYKMAKAGNWEKAIDYFEKAASEHRRCWEAHWNLGLAYEATGEYEQADSMLARAYEINSEDFIAEEISSNRILLEDIQE